MAKLEPYPSDMTDEEWQVLFRLLPRQGKFGRRARYDRRLMLNAIFYISSCDDERRGRYLSRKTFNYNHGGAERRCIGAMELQTLKDLYIVELKDLLSAEKQIIKALPKMVKAASNADLKAGFTQHLAETKVQATRLEEILTSHEQTTRGPKCKGMEGVLKEGEEMIEDEGDDEVRDAGLISAAQRVEHYEMAGYGCARTYAELLGDKAGAKLLQATLDEESATDKKLTKLAKTTINVAAAKA